MNTLKNENKSCRLTFVRTPADKYKNKMRHDPPPTMTYTKKSRTLRKPRTEHIRHIKLKGDMNNNKMERLNGEIRQREKTMRGLKRKDTPILKGYQIYHNYIR